MGFLGILAILKIYSLFRKGKRFPFLCSVSIELYLKQNIHFSTAKEAKAVLQPIQSLMQPAQFITVQKEQKKAVFRIQKTATEFPYNFRIQDSGAFLDMAVHPGYSGLQTDT